jgi:[ribosomal protein S5]-alanine N-acetyltransferase
VPTCELSGEQVCGEPCQSAAWEPWSLRAMVLRDEQRMVGFTSFHGPPGINDTGTAGAAEVGYTVFPESRCRGYATETCRAMLEWARREHGVRHFISGIEPSNGPSIRVIEKLGFTPLGLLVDGECMFELRVP